MLTPAQWWLVTAPMDLRGGMDRLLVHVRTVLGRDPFDGSAPCCMARSLALVLGLQPFQYGAQTQAPSYRQEGFEYSPYREEDHKHFVGLLRAIENEYAFERGVLRAMIEDLFLETAGIVGELVRLADDGANRPRLSCRDDASLAYGPAGRGSPIGPSTLILA